MHTNSTEIRLILCKHINFLELMLLIISLPVLNISSFEQQLLGRNKHAAKALILSLKTFWNLKAMHIFIGAYIFLQLL